MKTQLLAAAQDYYRRGWSVIPTKEKRPAIPWKRFQSQQPTEQDLEKWFGGSMAKVTGLAVIMGRASGGLACRDFDQEGAYDRWAESHPDLSNTLPTARTDRGFHVYARQEQEAYANLENGELRGDSLHYTVLPPSLHPSGCRYSWVVPPGPGPLPLVGPEALDTPTQGNPATHATHCNVSHSSSDVREAILATLPNGPGQRNRRLFELIRRLKAIPGLDTSPRHLELVVAEWHRLALPVICTKEFAESWSDFKIAWLRACVPLGRQGGLKAAAETIRSRPLPAEAAVYDGRPAMQQLVALCVELQRLVGDRAFFLSCRDGAALLGVDRMTVWRYLKELAFDGILEQGLVGSHASKKATEWRVQERKP